jgi:hypothetical protein
VRTKNTTIITALLSAAVVVTPFSDASASPFPGWTNERTLDCDGHEVKTYLSPAGFGTPFHVASSTEVIVPKYVTVTSEGETLITLDVPGFDHTSPHAIHCSYTDPLGLHVDLIGLRT